MQRAWSRQRWALFMASSLHYEIASDVPAVAHEKKRFVARERLSRFLTIVSRSGSFQAGTVLKKFNCRAVAVDDGTPAVRERLLGFIRHSGISADKLKTR